MKFLFLALLITTSVWADFKSEEPAIRKFQNEEFLNEKNYGPNNDMIKPFYDKLNAQPSLLKYFTYCAIEMRLHNRYKADKAFALSLESKFQGKALTPADWAKIHQFVGDQVLSENNTTIKTANGKDPKNFQDYYKTIRDRLAATSF
jgi:hypothetical protein